MDTEKKISRKTFLKMLGSALVLVVIAKFENIFNKTQTSEKTSDPNSYGNSTYGGGSK